jgi:hypothetical protein
MMTKTRQFAIPLLLLFFIAACRKDRNTTNSNPPPLPYTPVPQSTPVTTSLNVYYVSNNETSNPLYISTEDNTRLVYNPLIFGYTSPPVTLDKYHSVIQTSPALTVQYQGFDHYTSFTALNSLRNYIDVKLLHVAPVASLLYDTNTGTYDLPGSGKLTLPPYGLGHFGGPVQHLVSATYLNPFVEDYFVSLPAYPVYDENNKREYLQSFGIYLLIPWSEDNTNFAVNFNAAAGVKMSVPIPADLLESAPDSILVFKLFNSSAWRKANYAYKSGNNYEVNVDDRGFYNLAIPVDGVYVTVHIRTETGEPIPNTRFKLRSGNAEIADERTDAEGDALVFVPVNTDLSIEIRNDFSFSWQSNKSPFVTDFGSFNSSAEKTITYPDNLYLFPIHGKVFNCEGSLLESGTAVLHNGQPNQRGDDYLIPIVNGHFETSAKTAYMGYLSSKLDILDNSGKLLSTTNVVIGNAGLQYRTQKQRYNWDFYTCSDARRVYANYTIDTSAFEVEGAIGATEPLVTAKYNPPSGTKIELSDGNKSFAITFIMSGTGTAFFEKELVVNGENCLLDESQGWNQVYITRNDTAVDGFIEGWFDLNYTDPQKKIHNIRCNFRAKKFF